MALPTATDILVVGGGTSGAALAGLIARDTDREVLLLEAGPDYGPLDGGGWPASLLDARWLPEDHLWGYEGVAHRAQPGVVSFSRARVIGGCWRTMAAWRCSATGAIMTIGPNWGISAGLAKRGPGLRAGASGAARGRWTTRS